MLSGGLWCRAFAAGSHGRQKTGWKENLPGTEAADTELYEIISPRICRVNLAAWKYRRLPAEWLFRMFAQSALACGDDSDVFAAYLETAGKLVEQGKTAFSLSDWKRYLEDYKAAGMNPVHHSESYRKSESPSYRIIDCQFLRFPAAS